MTGPAVASPAGTSFSQRQQSIREDGRNRSLPTKVVGRCATVRSTSVIADGQVGVFRRLIR